MGDPLRLYGLKALVTNAGSGIGEAVSRTLLKHGCAVLAVDTVNSGVEQHFASVKGIDGYPVNLTDATRMPALIEEASAAASLEYVRGLWHPTMQVPPESLGLKRMV